MIVPVFDEDPDFIDGLLRRVTSQDGSRLLICVVNEPTTATAQQHERDRDLVRRLFQRATERHVLHHEHAWLLRGMWRHLPSFDLLLLDVTRGEWALAEKEGVGRARKLAADWALVLYEHGCIVSSWLGCTDADAQLPHDYFEVIEQEHAATALLFPFEHVGHPGTLTDGMIQLEATFRHYVLGLQFAGSPYAYHALGSALACRLPDYAAVRGFPNRLAGEDFYLLSKLAQLGPLKRVRSAPVAITTRLSDRVPFGTGPRLAQWLDRGLEPHAHPPEIYTWDPELFIALRELLRHLTTWAMIGHLRLSATPDWIEIEAREVFSGIASSLEGCPSPAHRVRRVHERFDALATLRWLNGHRTRRWPDVSLRGALAAAPWVGVGSMFEGQFDALEALRHLREVELRLPEAVGPRGLEQ